MDNFNDSKALAIEIAKILDKKKAQDVRVLKVESLTVLTDYFVIASGTSTTQVASLDRRGGVRAFAEGSGALQHRGSRHQELGDCWITPTSSCTSLCPTAAPTMIWSTCGQTDEPVDISEYLTPE